MPDRQYFDSDIREFVYIMSTPCLPGWVKIGRSNNPARRRKELSTAVPEPFNIDACWITDSPARAERLLHDFMELFRARSKAEFFQADRSVIIERDEYGAIVNIDDGLENLVDELSHVFEYDGIKAYYVHGPYY